MPEVRTSRLPGIAFAGAPVVAPEPLPRMDVAGFIGLAASGPIDIPVVVEDVLRFHEIFGPALELALDRRNGRFAEAQLAPAVRAFFRNGGRRCWVVRVAENASLNTFVLPGLIAAVAGNLRGLHASARSEGSWSDDLLVGVTGTQRAIGLLDGATANDLGFKLVNVAPGEVIRVQFTAAANQPGLFAFHAVPAPVATRRHAERPRTLTFDPSASFWFYSYRPNDLVSASDRFHRLEPPDRIDLLGSNADPNTLLSTERALTGATIGVHANQFVIEVDRDHAEEVRAGLWLRLHFSANSILFRGRTALLLIEELSSPPLELSSPPDSGDNTVWLRGSQLWVQASVAEAQAEATLRTARAATALRTELWVRDDSGRTTRLSQLGLAHDDERFLGHLPLDDELFAAEERVPESLRTLRTAALVPRFPLGFSRAFRELHALVLPLGAPALLREELLQPASIPDRTRLARDGVQTFSPALFLDPALAHPVRPGVWESVRAEALLAEAFSHRYGLGSGRQERRLRKLHALLSIDEVSIISIPDAVDWGWEPGSAEQIMLPPPVLALPESPDASGCQRLRWQSGELRSPPEAAEYELVESSDPLFTRSRLSYRGENLLSDCIEATTDCPTVLYYRVRARIGARRSAWSNTRAIAFRQGAFAECGALTLSPPELQPPRVQTGTLELSWSAAPNVKAHYRVETADDPAFLAPRTIDQLSGAEASIVRSFTRAPAQVAFYRVRAEIGGLTTPWSNTVAHEPEAARPVHVLLEPDEADPDFPSLLEGELLAVHTALLRVCAARGDALALLSLPLHYRAPAAARYVQRLHAQLATEDAERILSFGAFYHPWLVLREEPLTRANTLAIAPPDGTVAGLVAARSITRGAWIAPANQPLRSVVALRRSVPTAQLQLLVDQGVNPITLQAAGFQVLTADTLTTSAELRSIGVRRLLILLRRLALREGMRNVFQPNDDNFRRQIQRQFEQTLGDLFVRGALAGVTPAQAFRVVTDESVNPPQSIEQGRFIVELRVAPSEPLTFLLVRLIQENGALNLSEGNAA